MTHSSSIPPSLIFLHEPPVSLSLSLSLLWLTLPFLPSHHLTHTHTPRVLLTPSPHARLLSTFTGDRPQRGLFVFFFVFFFLLLFLCLPVCLCLFCPHVRRHHQAEASPRYSAWQTSKRQAADCPRTPQNACPFLNRFFFCSDFFCPPLFLKKRQTLDSSRETFLKSRWHPEVGDYG